MEGINLKFKLINDIQTIEDEIQRIISNNLKSFAQEKQNLINRVLFIENLYGNNNLAQKWEKDKRYYQSLPNIIISIGLIGTFLGITINLFATSASIFGKPLQDALPEIIGSMAIAFVSSLIALSCSLLLIKANPSYELDIVKDKLFLTLEFELEKKIIENQTYVDLNQRINDLVQVINNYSSNLSQFIIKLPQINQQFEKTITQAANNFNNQAIQSSQIIKDQTKTFTDTTALLDNTAKNLTQLTTQLTKLTDIYQGIVDSIKQTRDSLKNTTQSLDNFVSQNGQSVIALSNITSRIQVLIDSNQKNINQIADQLQENINTLSGTTQSLSSNTSQITGTLNEYTQQVETQNNKLQNISEQIATYIQKINQLQNDFQSLLELLKTSQNP